MDKSENFSLMLDKADLKDFDRTKNVQDQLQEMVDIPEHRRMSGLRAYLCEWLKRNIDSWRFEWSMEQLWLAFVMKEKHSKTWDGKDWIKQ